MSCTSIEKGNLPSSSIGKIYYIKTGILTFLRHILCLSSWIMGQGQIQNIYWLLMNFPDKLLTSCTSIEQVNLPSSSIGNIFISTPGSDIHITHIVCILLTHLWGQTENIYWLLINFPDNLLTSCTSIEQVNLPSSSIGNIYYINTGIVTFRAHILHYFSWLMGEGQMKKIYWLLMFFLDKLLTSCTSIEQVNLPSSSIGKIYYINTGIVTFVRHTLCLSSWIMGQGQMENINWLLMNFPDKLLTSCTSIEQVNLPFSSIGNIFVSIQG
jgi:hypothetical protein